MHQTQAQTNAVRLPVFVDRPRTRLTTLWQYRTLLYNLVLRDLKARYKNSALGFLWSLLNPLAMMVIFTVISTFLFRDNNVPNYPIFLLTGLLPWNFFSVSIMGGANSIVANGYLINKVYFPREVLPIAAVIANLVNFLLALLVLFAVIIFFGMQFSPWIWLLPIVILIQTIFTVGIVLFLSTLQVYYRDTLLILDVVILAWFFLTPVFYPASVFPQAFEIAGLTVNIQRLVYILNPMASLVNMYRDLLYWGYRTDLDFFLRTSVTAIIIFAFGYWFFAHHSDDFSEEV